MAAPRILFVEDNDAEYDGIVSLFSNADRVTLHREKTAAAALSQLKTGAFDLILFDYVLPDGIGSELLKQMNRQQILVPAICITDHGNESVALELSRLGAYDYLNKSELNNDKLVTAVRIYLEKFRLKNDMVNAASFISPLKYFTLFK